MSLTLELEHLKRRVNEIRAENWNGQWFVPKDQLCDIITQESIVKALGIVRPAYLTEEMVDFIVKRATKVFAILLFTDHVDEIKRFIQNDQFGTHCKDHQLPFTVSRLNEILDDEYRAKLFHEKQWEFTAPIISGRVMPRTLEKWTVLPYLSERHLATGGFGSVYKVKIHPTYHPPAFP